MPRQTLPHFFDIEAVSEALNVSDKTVRRLIKAGDLKAHKLGGRVRVSLEDYRAFVAARRG